MTNHQDQILSLQEVADMFGRSTKSVWRWHAKDKCFPAPIRINGRTIGWKQSVINEFLANQSK
ncbi:AlpA family phage regulatory protein [Vibrio fluvialis]|nr:AlpA family phage regulatory protein [Vibrio fluvialis]